MKTSGIILKLFSELSLNIAELSLFIFENKIFQTNPFNNQFCDYWENEPNTGFNLLFTSFKTCGCPLRLTHPTSSSPGHHTVWPPTERGFVSIRSSTGRTGPNNRKHVSVHPGRTSCHGARVCPCPEHLTLTCSCSLKEPLSLLYFLQVCEIVFMDEHEWDTVH